MLMCHPPRRSGGGWSVLELRVCGFHKCVLSKTREKKHEHEFEEESKTHSSRLDDGFRLGIGIAGRNCQYYYRQDEVQRWRNRSLL